MAKDKGGAIFAEPNYLPYLFNHQYVYNYCFYSVYDCQDVDNPYRNYFANNSGINGGNDIYGGPPERLYSIYPSCWDAIVHDSNNEYSSLSSDPTRVCLCNESGVPQCRYVYNNRTVYPGETLLVSAVVVGGNFGTTIGTVYAGFLSYKNSFLRPTSQYGQAIDNKQCNTLEYTIYSNQTNHTVILYLSQEYMDSEEAQSLIGYDFSTPVLFYITILPCPRGFTLTNHPPKCDCYQTLLDNDVKCELKNRTGYFTWSGNMWINIIDNGIIFTMYCPLDYCPIINKSINMYDNPWRLTVCIQPCWVTMWRLQRWV